MAKKRPQSRSRKAVSTIENSRWFVPVAFIVLLVAVVFLFSDFIFSDQMLYGSDILQASLTFRIYKVQHMAAGDGIPQWIPHQFAGMPYVEAFHSDIFYPPTLVFNYARVWFDDIIEPIDVARDLGWLLIIHIYLSGIFMYKAARQFKLGRIPALLAGASYMFAGYLVSMVHPGHDGKIYVASLFPLMMYFLDRGFDKRQVWPQVKYFSLVGLAIGFILLTPHPQMSYFSLWALSFFAAFRLIVRWVKSKSFLPVIRPGLLTVYAVVIGLAFSAIQMYPGVTYTSEYSPRADTKKGWEWATSWSLHEEEAASLVIPEFSGTSTQKVETYYWGKNYFKDNSEWLGTIALFLAIIGIAYYRRRKEVWFFTGLGVFALLYGLGATTPFFWIVYTLVPKVESMRAPSMIMFLGSFSVALLAGMGVQAVIEARSDKERQLGKKFRYVLFGFPGFVLLLALMFSVAGQTMLNIWTALFYSEASSEMIQQGVSKLDLAYMNLPAIQTGAWFAFLFCALAAAFVWLYHRGKAGRGILIALIALPVVDGIRFDSRFVDIVEPSRFSMQYNENGLTRFLANQEEPVRVVNLGSPKDANMLVHGIDLLVGYHGNQLRWYDDLLGGPSLMSVPEVSLLRRGVRANARFTNLAGAKYMIDPTGGAYPPDHFGYQPLVPIADLGNAQLMRNDNAFPRAFLVDNYKVIPGDTILGVRDGDTTRMRNIVIEVLEGDTDLRKTVLLEEEPQGLYSPDTTATSDSAWVIDYQADSVLVGVEVSTPKILVFTDVWFPSWHAYIDGEPAPTLRAYGAFRAVELPAGAEEVLFRYHSDRYVLGRTVTWVTVIYLVGVISFTTYWSHRRPEKEVDQAENETETETEEEES